MVVGWVPASIEHPDSVASLRNITSRAAIFPQCNCHSSIKSEMPLLPNAARGRPGLLRLAKHCDRTGPSVDDSGAAQSPELTGFAR
jgi:hypothetical protein